ncbi:D-alanyl-D-alanine carboxypeptidase [Streptomyces curacoi]|uniref:serine-type D-Ala-D-Ala carboxypeptidase n=1 Tax=Streptomyces curacoi TaxID=146536 RepID=A0A117P3R4_9ACTN|nr:D-alanyl-D-alanine carboxypeptidase [Streptomyces curacoi]
MAGESPDRSKQRESSAEPTSGSAGPVPESRTETAGTPAADAAERRDPRLAVARENAAARGGVDTATRVLSRRELEAAQAEQEKSQDTGDAKAETESAEDAKGAEAEAAAQGDDRLKEAVAAWVASADPADTTDAEGEETTPGAAEDDADADARDEGEGAEGAKDATGAGADAARGSDAADGAAAGEAQDAADAGADDADARDEGEGADAGIEPETDVEEGAKAASGAHADAGDEADGSDAETAPKADSAAEPEADADTEASDETAGAAEGGSGEPAKAADADDAPAAANGEDAPQGPPAPDDESRTGGAGGNTKAEGEAEADPKPAVDQPTAVFKAVRPTDPTPKSKPAVDQPTTMLKAPKPEAPAERTSKFVALKPDIKQDTPKAPDAPKTPSAPDATAAIPQVGPERTTQQPLPPKPPLDLLAELTNTPPPPDTPVRTLIRRVKIWTPLVILLAIVFAVVQSVRPLPAPTLDLTAKDTYTFDGGKIDIPWPAQGQAALDVDGIGSFGSSGDQKPVPIASVAKVMTAYVILRDHPLKSGAEGPKIEIDQAAEDQSDAGQESTVDVTKGDKITQREALESILIASANNVARLLARWDAGSEKAFVAKMNAAADDLGMKNTTYTDPSGLNDTTVSTAVDQVKLAKAAMKEPAFREVAAMMSYDDYKGVNHSNWNQLVGKNNVVGIKTGTTTSALGNLVFAAKKEVGGETRTIVGAVVRQPAGGPENTILSAALHGGDQLIRAAQDALESATILKKGDVVGYVDDGLGGRTPVVATKDVTAVGWSGLKVELTFASDDVPHTAKAGTKVGTLTVGDGTSGAVKIPVALQSDLAEPGFTDKLTRLG